MKRNGLSSSAIFRDAFRFHVAPVKVTEFARALWDANPAFHGLSPKRVPLTFPGAVGQMAARPHLATATGLDVSRAFHGEERIHCYRAPRVDEVLDVEVVAHEDGMVSGTRGGTMRRVVVRSDMRSPNGEPVARVDRVLLETSRSTVELERRPSEDRLATTDPGMSPRDDPLKTLSVDPWKLEAGAQSPRLTIGPLTRTDFVRYAGASGDYTAIHFDDIVAKMAGFPATFAMGMLSGGFLARLFTDWLAHTGSYELVLRFRSPIFPGDRLMCMASFDRGDQASRTFEAVATVDDLEVTSATLTISAAPGSKD